MRIHNTLPLFLDCLNRWDRLPSQAEFEAQYARPMEPHAGDFFEDFHDYLTGLNWELYRSEALTLDPTREQERVTRILKSIETLFGFTLEGEILIYGSFATMDGFARFDRGRHRVYLGVDESHGRGRYLDVLIAHELTHVARETRPEVWEGWGLAPKMPRKVYRNAMTVIEHLMSEGFSCAVSELVVPDEGPWAYVYQDADGLARILQHGPALDRVIHEELRHPDGDFGRFYANENYTPPLPDYAHYVWAWKWVKELLARRAGGDPRKLVGLCSKDLVEDALAYRLR